MIFSYQFSQSNFDPSFFDCILNFAVAFCFECFRFWILKLNLNSIWPPSFGRNRGDLYFFDVHFFLLFFCFCFCFYFCLCISYVPVKCFLILTILDCLCPCFRFPTQESEFECILLPNRILTQFASLFASPYFFSSIRSSRKLVRSLSLSLHFSIQETLSFAGRANCTLSENIVSSPRSPVAFVFGHVIDFDSPSIRPIVLFETNSEIQLLHWAIGCEWQCRTSLRHLGLRSFDPSLAVGKRPIVRYNLVVFKRVNLRTYGRAVTCNSLFANCRFTRLWSFAISTNETRRLLRAFLRLTILGRTHPPKSIVFAFIFIFSFSFSLPFFLFTFACFRCSFV